MSARDDYPEPPRRGSRAGSGEAMNKTLDGWQALRQEMCDEIDRLRARGTPGVMHAVDRAFYDLTIKQRDAAWREIEALKAAWEVHDCADKFPTMKVPKGRIISIEFPEGVDQEPILMIPVIP